MTRSARDLRRSPSLNLVSSVEARNKTDMKIAARVSNTSCGHTVEVETEGRKQSIAIAPKSAGRGSSINGGELLFSALATCFCNDLYREAAKRGIGVHGVEVEVTGTFGNPGEPARDITYRVQVDTDAPEATIDDLIRATDSVAEIQNTLRASCAVQSALGCYYRDTPAIPNDKSYKAITAAFSDCCKCGDVLTAVSRIALISCPCAETSMPQP